MAKAKSYTKTFKCAKEKCLTCPFESCIYDVDRKSIIYANGELYKVVRSTKEELSYDNNFEFELRRKDDTRGNVRKIKGF